MDKWNSGWLPLVEWSKLSDEDLSKAVWCLDIGNACLKMNHKRIIVCKGLYMDYGPTRPNHEVVVVLKI